MASKRRLEQIKAWAKANPEKVRAASKRHSLKKLYGLSEDAYNALLQSQNNQCKLCGKVKKLDVDHDHYTGRVRGLLCRSCNYHLSFIEHPGTLERAMVYLGR